MPSPRLLVIEGNSPQTMAEHVAAGGTAASKGSAVGTIDLLCRAHVDDVITDPDHLLAVADHHHRVTGARSLNDRVQHPGFRRGIQMRGGLVEKQYRRT